MTMEAEVDVMYSDKERKAEGMKVASRSQLRQGYRFSPGASRMNLTLQTL